MWLGERELGGRGYQNVVRYFGECQGLKDDTSAHALASARAQNPTASGI